jgi:integrase
MALSVQSRRVTEGKGSVHGWRATFRTWAADNGVPDEVAELCLSHLTSKTVRAYNRAEMVERRRRALQDWADYLDGKAAADNVVRLKRA